MAAVSTGEVAENTVNEMVRRLIPRPLWRDRGDSF
jgi:hypothetical protein